MPELHLQRTGDMLTARFGEHTASVPWADVAPTGQMAERIKKDAGAYGRTLFEQIFHEEHLRAMLTTLRSNERLLLVIDQPEVAALPWEYLRGPNNKLLASRLNFVRSVPEAQRQTYTPKAGPLEIVALSVSPVDEARILNTEREWRRLIDVVTQSSRSLTLTRVRPPTRTVMERTFGGNMSIVHFMGHSDSTDGEGLLIFEDIYGGSDRVDAAGFTEVLDQQEVFLVVLNSCSSAVATTTAFGNIAQAVVKQGIPYALGMQFVLPDEAALEISRELYSALLQGRTLEEAVRRTRRALESNTSLYQPLWLAGIPVLYTSLRAAARPITLATGRPTIHPDPTRLQKTFDLTALPQAWHFTGRGDEIREVVAALLESRPVDFVVLHGLGGTGKTALARNIAERVSWHYGDCVLAFSFETFARLTTGNQLLVDEQFADRFINELAHFYGIGPAGYTTTADLQRAILQKRDHVRSLLVLDNIETLIDAQKNSHPLAKTLAAFISRLKEGDGAILLTSRTVPPKDWGDCKIVSIGGLAEESGGSLFLALLPPERRPAALPDIHRELSRRVQGHPLSIRLLAGRFAEATTSLQIFLKEIEAELQVTEQSTPTSLEDPGRQATIYACMTYSVRRLTTVQTEVLQAISLFQAPFLSWFASYVLNDDKQEHIPADLQNLQGLGLLERRIGTYTRNGKEGEIELLVLHPMLRWYIQHHLAKPTAAAQERYGRLFAAQAISTWRGEDGYDQSGLTRFLARQSLPDFEAALQSIPPGDRVKSTVAAYLAKIYLRLGQSPRALALYESALVISQDMNDEDNAVAIQLEIAALLRKQGRPQEALGYCEQAYKSCLERGETDLLATVLSQIGYLLTWQGRPQEAWGYYERAIQSKEEQGDVRSAAIMRGEMANLLREQGRLPEAMALYEQALNALQTAGNTRDRAIILHEMARLLAQQGHLPEAMALYEQALTIKQELGDAYSAAVTQSAIVGLLGQQGRLQEAMDMCEECLDTLNKFGNVRDWAIALSRKADLLALQEQTEEAMSLYERALQSLKELGDVREATEIQEDIAKLLLKQGQTQEAIHLYEQALHTHQELGGLGEAAVVEAQLGQIFFQQQDYQRALPLIWHAYTIYDERGYTQSAQEAQAFLVAAKNLLAPAKFDALWEQAISEPQPDWLRREQAGASYKPGPLSAELLGNLIANTVTVMTVMDEQRAEWRQIIAGLLQRAQDDDRPQEAAFFAAILAVLDGQEPSLPKGNPHAGELATIQARIVEIRAASESGSFEIASIEVSEEMMQAVWDFVNAKNWESIRGVLEAQQTLLFRQEVDVYLEYLNAEARSQKEQLKAEELDFYRSILQECKTHGIAATFERITELQNASPFAELISRSVSALLGNPQEKRAHEQFLVVQASQTTDEELRALLDAIQLALFGGEFSQLGGTLKGVYQHAWQTIVGGVEAGKL